MELDQKFSRSKSEISLASEHPATEQAEEHMTMAIGVEERERMTHVVKEVGRIISPLDVVSFQDDGSDPQWKDMSGSVIEEIEHVGVGERVEQVESRKSRQGSSSRTSNTHDLSQPNAEARARWAMLASLAGVSHNEHSHHARDENMSDYQAQDHNDARVSYEDEVPDHDSGTSFLEMPDPDDFIRPPVNMDDIDIGSERLQLVKEQPTRNPSDLIDKIEASVEYAVSKGASTIDSASSPHSDTKRKSPAIYMTSQERSSLAKTSMALRIRKSDTKPHDPEKAAQSTTLEKVTRSHQQTGLQQTSSHPLRGLNETSESEKTTDPSQSRTHRQTPSGILAIQNTNKLDPIPTRVINSTQIQPMTLVTQPAAAREGRRTIRDNKLQPLRSAAAIGKPTSKVPHSKGWMPVRSPLPPKPSQRDSEKQVLQPQQTPERLSAFEQGTSPATEKVAPAEMGASLGFGDDPGVKSLTSQDIASRRRYSKSSPATPSHLPRDPLPNGSTPNQMNLRHDGLFQAFDQDESEFSDHKPQTQSQTQAQTQGQATESSSGFPDNPTLEIHDKPTIDPTGLQAEILHPFGDFPERQSTWQPSNIMKQPLGYEDQDFHPSEIQQPSAEIIVNGIESYLDTFEQQQQMTIETVKDGQAGFLDSKCPILSCLVEREWGFVDSHFRPLTSRLDASLMVS